MTGSEERSILNKFSFVAILEHFVV